MSTTTIQTPASVIWRGYDTEGGHIWADENHRFPGAIPLEAVRDDLFGWHAQEGSVKVDVLTEDGVTTYHDPDHKGIVNPTNSRVMGLPSISYAVHQFDDWLLHNVAGVLGTDTSLLGIGGAATFKHGAVAVVQVELPETHTVNGIGYRTYLNAATSHDGSIASTYTLGNTLIICSNMMGSMFRGGVKIRHTSNSADRISGIGEALGILNDEAMNFGREIDRLTQITVTDAQWQEVVESITGLDRTHLSTRSQGMADRKARDLHGVWNSDDMVSGFKGTAFGVLQAVSTYRHHYQTVRGANRAERNVLGMVTGAHAAEDTKTLALLERVLTAV